MTTRWSSTVVSPDMRYEGASIESKVLCGQLLDRMACPQWLDGRCQTEQIYIRFIQKNSMTLMNCGKDKSTKPFRELNTDDSGLIERRKQAQDRPAWTCVKNFIPLLEGDQMLPEPDSPRCSATCGKSTSKTARVFGCLGCRNTAGKIKGLSRALFPYPFLPPHFSLFCKFLLDFIFADHYDTIM